MTSSDHTKTHKKKKEKQLTCVCVYVCALYREICRLRNSVDLNCSHTFCNFFFLLLLLLLLCFCNFDNLEKRQLKLQIMKNFLYEAEQQVNTTVNYKKIRKKENFSNCQFNIFIFLPQLTRVFLGTSKHSIPRSF